MTVGFPPTSNVEAQLDELKNHKPKERNAEGKPLLVEILYDLNKEKTKRAYLKVFEGDDPHELAVKFCDYYNLRDDDDIEWYSNDIGKEKESIAQIGYSDSSRTTLYRGLGLPKGAL